MGTHVEAFLSQIGPDQLRSPELLKQILDSLPVGVWVMDRGGRIVHGNPAGQKIWAGARYVGTEQFGEYKGWWRRTGRRWSMPVTGRWASTRRPMAARRVRPLTERSLPRAVPCRPRPG